MLVEHNEVSNVFTACPSGRIPWDAVLAGLVTEGDEEMTTYKLFQTWGPPQLWLIAYVANVPIYRRWIVTQSGADRLIAEVGQPETIGLDQLATIPSL